MLFMVIERYPTENEDRIGDRFRERGRMLPPGVTYEASWIEENGRCFQLITAPDADSLTPWVGAWQDLVDFEIVPVLPSADYWASRQPI